MAYTDKSTDADLIKQFRVIKQLESTDFRNWPTETRDNCMHDFLQELENKDHEAEVPNYNVASEGDNFDKLFDTYYKHNPSRLKELLIDVESNVLTQMRETRKFKDGFEMIESIAGLSEQGYIDRIIKYDSQIEKSVIRNLSALSSWKSRNYGI